MNTSFEAFFTIGLALLIIAAFLPLALRKVRMNHVYGFRTAESFQSESRWYEINAAGGKIVVCAAIPILLAGVAKLFVAPSLFVYLNAGALVLPLLICLMLNRAAKRPKSDAI